MNFDNLALSEQQGLFFEGPHSTSVEVIGIQKGGIITLEHIVRVLRFYFPQMKGEMRHMGEVYNSAVLCGSFSCVRGRRDVIATHEYTPDARIEFLISPFGIIEIELTYLGKAVVRFGIDTFQGCQMVWPDRGNILGLREHGSRVAAFVGLMREVETAGTFNFSNLPEDVAEVMKRYA